MALEGESHLDDAPAQQDQAHGADQAEDEIGQVVDNGEGVAARSGSGKRRHGAAAHQRHRRHQGAVVAVAPLHLVGHGQAVLVLALILLTEEELEEYIKNHGGNTQ